MNGTRTVPTLSVWDCIGTKEAPPILASRGRRIIGAKIQIELAAGRSPTSQAQGTPPRSFPDCYAHYILFVSVVSAKENRVVRVELPRKSRGTHSSRGLFPNAS